MARLPDQTSRPRRVRSALFATAIAVVAAGAPLPVTPAHAGTATVTADFGTYVDYPLVKSKFGVYNSCLVPTGRYDRDINVINELDTDSLRIDGGFGGDPNCGYVTDPVSGTASSLTYDWTDPDQFVRNLNDRNVAPYFSYGYQPTPLQIGGDWRSKPSSYPAWQNLSRDTAAHFDQTGNPLGYHEIWNEPDFGTTFFTGTRDEYFQMYGTGVTGIRQADPDAVVGGLSSAFRTEWISPFLDYVETNDLPLDFISFHQYPGNAADEPALMNSYLNEFKTRLATRSLHTAELHLNEYNSYPINYPQGGTQDKSGLAPALLRDYKNVLSQPSLDKVSWAQFMDSGLGNYSGMVTIDGYRKAVFNAAKIYAMLPAERRQLTITGGTGIDGLAAADDHRAGMVLWNKTGSSHTINAVLNGIAFPTGTLRVYRIDANNASYGDNPATEDLTPVETYANVATAGRTWSGSIPHDGVVYLEFTDGTTIASNQEADNGEIVRTLSYRPDRFKASYADFEPKTWTARLGMATETWADEEVGVTVDQTPALLNFRNRVDGTLQNLDANSCACVRIDYQVGSGYTKSVLFHGPYNGSADLYSSTRSAPFPWGTQAQATQVVAVPNLAQFAVDTAAYAPANWTGRTQITWLLQNSGPGTRLTSAVGNGLVGAWGFDEASGTTAVDSSGVGNAGTIANGTRGTGVTRSALTFNGTSSSVAAGTSSTTSFGTENFTIATWFRSSATGFTRLVSKGNFGNSNGYLLALNNGTITLAAGAGGNQSQSLGLNTPGGFNDGAWHHVAAVVNRSSGNVRVLIDGVPQALTVGAGFCGTANGSTVDVSACPAANASSSQALTLGSYNGTAEFFNGALDDVRLYNRAIEDIDVRALAGLGKLPVARWTLDDAGGTRATDSSGGRNHGFVSAPTWTTGPIGGALDLNGTASTVGLGNPSRVNFGTGSFTLATHLRTTGTSFQRVISKGNFGNTNGYLLATNGGGITFAMGSGGNQAQSLGMNTPAGFNDGNWHHVAVVVNGSARTVQIYVDGVAQPLAVGTGYCGTASGTTVAYASCSPKATSKDRLHLGSYNGTTEFFDGALDDVRLYNRAIGASELAGIRAGY